jgi:tricorn protease
MEAGGFADFHRYFLVESQRDGLIIDVRWNIGGHVSSLLIEKLTKRTLGWAVSRYGSPARFPEHALNGPMVMLVDENTSSDGEIIADTFARLGLGKVLGKRTWGGVLGMAPEQLIDGTFVTLPMEGYHVAGTCVASRLSTIENHGFTPDIEVAYPPQAYKTGLDPQLQAAIATALAALDQGENFLPGPSLSS